MSRAAPTVVYRLTLLPVYPSTFCDHGSSGFGTLKGITSKVPYLHQLGVDVLWLSPLYQSPLADMGYDISDYQKIDERYGTLDDWKELRDALHERGMRLVMDLVVNRELYTSFIRFRVLIPPEQTRPTRSAHHF